MPTIGDLSADRLNEFKNHSFLIAITGGDLSPVVSFAGKEIFAGAGADGIKAGASLDSITEDSLLALLIGFQTLKTNQNQSRLKKNLMVKMLWACSCRLALRARYNLFGV